MGSFDRLSRLPEELRRQPCGFAKDSREMALARIAHTGAYLCYREIGLRKQSSSPLNPQRREIRVGSGTCQGSEEPSEMKRAQVRRGCDFRE
jgi:hypothetical protein